MGSKKKHKKKHKFSKFLTEEQKFKYKQFGEPDPTQDYLELFTPDVISDLFTIMRSCSDNQRKSDYITKEFKSLGFYDVGLGTNIHVMANPVYPGVVFKVALDDYGLADNFNDVILQDCIPHYVKVLARHPSSIVSVQERGVKPTQQQMAILRPKILGLLKELSKYFLIADLSPDMYLNYTISRDGDFQICDGSDLYPLHQIKEKIRCKRITGEHPKSGAFKHCEGKLKYTDDFKSLVCEKCGRVYNPLELRPKKEVEKMQQVLSDGYSAEERKAMEMEEIEAIRKAQGLSRKTDMVFEQRVSDSDPDEDLYRATSERVRDEPRTIFVYPDEDSEEEEEESINHFSSREDLSADDLDSDEDGESEADENDIDDDDDRDEDGFIVLSRREPVREPVDTTEESDDEDEDDPTDEPDMNRLTDSFVEKINWMRETYPDEFQDYVKALITAIGKDVILDILNDVKNDSDNTVIPKVVQQDEPHIKYRVVEEDDNPDTLPGIFLNIQGDFEEAYYNSGLPIFVSIGDNNVSQRAITSGEIKALLTPVVNDLKESITHTNHYDDLKDSGESYEDEVYNE